MVVNIIMNMYDNTDDNSILFINGWSSEPEEVFSYPRFYKCKMNWDFNKAYEFANQASELCNGLVALGNYCKRSGQDVLTLPVTLSLDDDEADNAALSAWDMFFSGYDYESISTDELVTLA